MDYQASDLRNQGKDDNSDEIKLLKEKALLLFLDLHNAIDIIINALIAMQNVLRGKYSKYDIE